MKGRCVPEAVVCIKRDRKRVSTRQKKGQMESTSTQSLVAYIRSDHSDQSSTVLVVVYTISRVNSRTIGVVKVKDIRLIY